MGHTIWFMEGLSSQRDLILGIKDFFKDTNKAVIVIASHRHSRNEILALADISLIEPADDEQRLNFIATTVENYGVQALHTGRNCKWFEAHRQQIESLGVSLTTGATSTAMFALADDKVEFALTMEARGLPVVLSQRIESAEALRHQVERNAHNEDDKKLLCVKPVTGIYGMGFWRFDDNATAMSAFTHPDSRKVHPEMYLHALEQQEDFEPLVLMPYLPGPEYSVDMLVEKGNVIAAVARRKEGALQYLEQSGPAYELGKKCAQIMQADGLVNVQTRNNDQGEPVLLEINMRPSGGIGYTRHSGVNLPALFALRQLGLMDESQAKLLAVESFSPAVVRSMTDVIRYNPILDNLSASQGSASA
ncbi:ATP-grasp domain-containing protein [Rouxiella silvae]|uniref:ATP-grasp domain-containing protein n=3 Tax=Yersiniaceae TaxID=1903411 RepID=A0ABW6CAD3_RAHSY|nr:MULTISPECIES: ATP-grasp domain-containing protein [Yersiniaceae]MBF6639161.1 ATP-grasp domain-containing protein [Rouxiella silvae]MBU9826710.1 ATP-grasp domain-containing protein [Rahnella perminowiae]MBU9833746.1 ATP-grasp domain-containing protein [Rahnella perminowiae]